MQIVLTLDFRGNPRNIYWQACNCCVPIRTLHACIGISSLIGSCLCVSAKLNFLFRWKFDNLDRQTRVTS
jgi:hypothetical protein